MMRTEFEYRRPALASAGRVLWNTVRLSIAAVLLLLEPAVAFICGAGLVLGVLAWLAEHGFVDVEEIEAVRETLTFALPPELRRDIKAHAER